MWPNFWKACLISLAAYGTAIVSGFWLSFEFTLFAILALQVVWTAFCGIRVIQLRRCAGRHREIVASDRESYGFSLGGLISSCALLLVVVVATQVV
jgi:hypothetical protein